MMATLGNVLLFLVPIWPLLLALGLVNPLLRGAIPRLLTTAAMPALLAALLPLEGMSLSLPWLLLGSGFGLDEVSRVFLLFSALLWSAAALVLPEEGRYRFSAWFLVSMAGNFGVLLALEIPTFFLAYAVMSLASFGLVIHRHTRAARRAARVYLVFAVLGEMILLSALGMIAHSAGTLELGHVIDRAPQHLLLALLLLGFGIKSGVPLLHVYLPPAYAAAPLAAAVPMAGALLHLGLYGWMRFLPLGHESIPEWSAIFIAVGILAAFYGIAVGLLQRQAKALLAYSSISQMGLMTIALGIGLSAPEHWPESHVGLMLYAMHHALAKGALFHGLGTRGTARIGLWLPALALAGLPLTSGAIAKAALKDQTVLLPETLTALPGWTLPLASVGTSLLMARFLFLALALDREAPQERTSPLAWPLLLFAGLLLPWLWPLSLQRTSPLWGALWPILLAAGPAWLLYKRPPARFRAAAPTAPPGDLLLVMERTLRRMPWPYPSHPAHKKEHDQVLHPRATPFLLAAGEEILARWPVALGLLLSLLIGIVLLAHD